MSPDKKQIKSSMLCLGLIHEVNTLELSTCFGVDKNHYLELTLNKKLCSDIISKSKSMFFPSKITHDSKIDLLQIDNFSSYEYAYYQLIYEITQCVYNGIKFILDSKNTLKEVYISGGFNRNHIFVEYLGQMMPEQKIKFPKGKNASALGAAMLMRGYL